MDTIKNLEEIEKAFYHDGFQLGMACTETGGEKELLFRAIKEMYVAVDQMIDSLTHVSKTNNKPVHCHSGCASCCYQPVFALDYELDYLANYIKKELDEEKCSQIAKRSEEKDQKLAGLEGSALLNAKHPCPLLENGRCIAYAARPMACRIYLSFDENSCRHFLSHPEDNKSHPLLAEIPLRLGRLMNEGFKSALKLHGHPAVELRIEEGLIPRLKGSTPE